MRNLMFLKAAAVIVIVTFSWTNVVWASGVETFTVDKLAAPHYAPNPVELKLLVGEMVVKKLKINNLRDVVANMQALTKAGVKCFVGKDTEGNTATYVIEDGVILRRTKAGSRVDDAFYKLLKLLGITSRTIREDNEVKEYIRVTEKNQQFINSVLRLLNPQWTVKKFNELRGPLVSRLANRQYNRAAFSKIGAMIMGIIYIAIGLAIYAHREKILTLILLATVADYIIFGLMGIPVVFALCVYTLMVVFPVDWYMFDISGDSAKALLLLLEKNPELEGKLMKKFGADYRKVLNAYILIEERKWNELVKLGTSVVPVVEKALGNNENAFVRVACVEVLARIGDKSIMPALEKALKRDRDASVRAAGARVLGKAGDKSVIPLLENALNNDRDSFVRGTAAGALLQLLNADAGLVTEYSSKYGADYRNILNAYILVGIRQWDEVVVLGNSATPALGAALWLDEEDSVRIASAKAIGRIGDRKAKSVLKGETNHFYTSVPVSIAVAEALAVLEDYSRIDFLMAIMNRHEDKHLRVVAAEALARLKRENGTKYLRDVVARESWYDMSVYIASLEALARLGDEGMPEALIGLLKNRDYVSAHRQCVEALGRVGNGKKIVDALLSILNRRNEDRDLYFSAAASLAGLGVKRGVDWLVGALSSRDYYEVEKAKKVLRDEGYVFQNTGDGLVGQREVDISEFREVKSDSDYRDYDYIWAAHSKIWMGMPAIAKDSHKAAALPAQSVPAPKAVPDQDNETLRRICDELKADREFGAGYFTEVRDVVLADNLDSPNTMDSLAVFQNGTMTINKNALGNILVLKSVVKRCLRRNVLEIVEQNKGVAKAAEIYWDLLDFAEMSDTEQETIIMFLGDDENGLGSKDYVDFLMKVKDIGSARLKEEGLISAAISYVLSEPRYNDISPGLKEGMSSEVMTAIEGCTLVVNIYNEISQAIDKVPAVAKVSNAYAAAMELLRKRASELALPPVEMRREEMGGLSEVGAVYLPPEDWTVGVGERQGLVGGDQPRAENLNFCTFFSI